MNTTTFREIEALYYDTDIPDTAETETAQTALAKAAQQGKKDLFKEDTLYELKTACEKQGFVSGFRCAARMFGLLMEARG